jgi:DNA-directed RNA polymerase subunit F
MEILSSSNASILCNYEVHEILKEKRSLRPGIGSNLNLQNRENIELKLLKYFNDNSSSNLSLEKVSEFVKELNEANISFTKAEYLVLLNQLPRSPVEIYVVWFPISSLPHLPSLSVILLQIIEECAERLSDDQVQYVIDCIQKYLL